MGKIDVQRSPWLCRILDKTGTASVGSGFRIGSQNVLTCAHVVTEALASTPGTDEVPTEELVVEFPTLSGSPRARAFVVSEGWIPPEPKGGGDVAVLALRTLPTESVEIPIEVPKSTLNHPYRAYGFPVNQPVAIESSGTIGGFATADWIGLEGALSSRSIEPGFSGGPVWDDELGAVVGMVVADFKGLRRGDADTWPAYMLSMPTLRQLLRDVPISGWGPVQLDDEGVLQKRIRCASFDGATLMGELGRWLEAQGLIVTLIDSGNDAWEIRARRRAVRKVPLDTLRIAIAHTEDLVTIAASTGLASVIKMDIGALGGTLGATAAVGALRSLRRGGSASRIGALIAVGAAAGAAAVNSYNLRQEMLQRCVTVAEYYAYSPEVGRGQQPIA